MTQASPFQIPHALEQQLQSELNLPSVGCGRRNFAEYRIRVTGSVGCRHKCIDRCRSAANATRQSEVGMVQDIEKFGAELDSNLLGDSRILHGGEIQIGDAGAVQ